MGSGVQGQDLWSQASGGQKVTSGEVKSGALMQRSLVPWRSLFTILPWGARPSMFGAFAANHQQNPAIEVRKFHVILGVTVGKM